MKFALPQFLLAVPALWAVLGAGLWLARRRRLALLAQFAGSDSRRSDAGSSASRRVWDRILVFILFTSLMVALARPLYFQFDESNELNGAPYLVALDASRSMLAADVRPTRYGAATNALDHFFAETRGDRIGIITFAGVGYLNAPLTFDTTALRTLLSYVNPLTLTDPGSSISSALDRAARFFTSNSLPQRTLIVISDGEDLDGKSLALARRLHHDHSITIHTIGVGTALGGHIPSQRGGTVTNSTGYAVVTKLDENNLRRIANAGGGRYYRLGNGGEGLHQLREEVLRPLAEKAARNELENYREGYLVPLGIAIAALLARLLVGADRIVRRRPASGIFPASP